MPTYYNLNKNMATTILRFEKIKSFKSAKEAGRHQMRMHKETPNADPHRKSWNKLFIGTNDLEADVKKRLAVLDKEPRKNSVLAMEGILSLTPYMLMDGKSEKLDNVRVFYNEAKKWLEETFGDNLVNAIIHRDESSPHIHFTVVPIVDKGDKKGLSARDTFNKVTLSKLQKSYYQHMGKAFPELEPPEYGNGNKVSHTKIKDFYRVIDEVMADIPRAAKEYLNDIKEECRQTMVDKYLPMVDSMLEKVEQSLENKLTDEMREDIKAKFKAEMESNINKSFVDTPTLKGAQAKIDKMVDGAKIKINAAQDDQPRVRFSPR
jgi:BMFP domain-containing protein YqiC